MSGQAISQPLELSIPFPRIPHTSIHLHLTLLSTSVMLFVTSRNVGEGDTGAAPLGSFVYSLPDVCRKFVLADVSLSFSNKMFTF